MSFKGIPTPSYADMGVHIPRETHPPNYYGRKVTCSKCRKVGGTLVNKGTSTKPDYRHEGC